MLGARAPAQVPVAQSRKGNRHRGQGLPAIGTESPFAAPQGQGGGGGCWTLDTHTFSGREGEGFRIGVRRFKREREKVTEIEFRAS